MVRNASATTRSRTSGVDRTLQILDMLSARGTPSSAYDIAKTIGAPVSTIYALVDDLAARGMLSKPDDKRVWLGPRLMRYGLAYESGMDLLTEAKHEMNRLARRLGETIQVCYRDEGDMVVAAMADGDGHFRISSDVGARVPLNWTASGRLLLGHLPEDERLAIFRKIAQPSHTGLAETDPERLCEHAARDFRARLAVQLGASDFAVACIAAPIRDASGACVLTISIVLAEPKARANLDRYGRAVQEAASAVEQALGRSAA
ncbi:IclR family transcriptional regulator [Pararhizobium mangrovi]|uniref:IclR family transcriptional regulator n=1 Tax=Pararhizobium mangrovi TaxID=2590452 RepID=A0A506UFN4_9HYPH|nr:IclR family transcriptional regulator [Pararhizobium mangrovi]TPW30657.1 IclR family transcriptional regulator [Pararhizobium mangrovi]